MPWVHVCGRGGGGGGGDGVDECLHKVREYLSGCVDQVLIHRLLFFIASDSAPFLCAALMSPQRTKQFCPQIEYIALI